ncbi:MAG: hypothetical protein RSC66_06670, partial [Comamonas sp.]
MNGRHDRLGAPLRLEQIGQIFHMRPHAAMPARLVQTWIDRAIPIPDTVHQLIVSPLNARI